MSNLQLHWYDLVTSLAFLIAVWTWKDRLLVLDGSQAFRLRWSATYFAMAVTLAFYRQEILVWSAIGFLLAAPKLMLLDQVGSNKS